MPKSRKVGSAKNSSLNESLFRFRAVAGRDVGKASVRLFEVAFAGDGAEIGSDRKVLEEECKNNETSTFLSQHLGLEPYTMNHLCSSGLSRAVV
jgi:hypothetical protein